ncbi:MAG TPA: threonine synthase [Armatimonadota bacterium]
MPKVLGLKCKECGEHYEKAPIHVCEYCFGPLEVEYDYTEIAKTVSRASIEAGPPTMWRYRDLLPLDGEPRAGLQAGFTPLIRAKRLGEAIGHSDLWIKNDAVNCPTMSFKDRVVAVALGKAIEFGYDTVACASTGNLANSVAAQAAQAGLKAYVFIPDDLERSKVVGTLVYGATVLAVRGNYDEVNRLASEVAGKYKWGFANVNLRPFYGDGSKTFGHEIAEQLGWRAPRHVVCPIGGGSLITKILKGFREFHQLGLIDEVDCRMYAAQAAGCNPVSLAIKTNNDMIRPQKPNTIAKSIAIGNPADGYYAVQAAKTTGGWGEDVSEDEIVDAIKLLARTEGIFTETAGGVTVGVAKKLIEQGRIPRDETTVIAITGNGLKTIEPVEDRIGEPLPIAASLASLEKALAM